MKRLKRVICYLLISALLIGVISVPGYENTVVHAEETSTGPMTGIVENDHTTSNLTWTLTEDTPDDWDLSATPYKLTISLTDPNGSGDFPMWTAVDPSYYPWHSYRGQIKTLCIEEGVTTISGNAFADLVSIKTLKLPESLTQIGYRSFYGCTQLTSITIPDRVESIGNGAFYKTKSVTSIQFGTGLKTIGSGAFDPGDMAYGNNVTELVFNEGLETIGSEAFLNFKKLRSIKFPDSLTTIGEKAFYNTSMAGTLTIPKNVTSIGTKAFFTSYGSWTGIEVAPENTVFEAVDNVLYQKSADGIPESVIVCASKNPLTEIHIQDGVKTINESAFAACSLMESITFPDSVQTVKKESFSNCDKLNTIKLGKGLEIIESGFAKTCEALENIEVNSENPYIETVDGVLYSKDHQRLYLYPAKKADTSYSALPETTKIDTYAIQGANLLEQLYLPESLAKIDDYAVWYNKNLKEVYFAGNAPEVGGISCFDHSHKDLLYYLAKGTTGWDTSQWKSILGNKSAEWNPNLTGQTEGSFDALSFLFEESNGKLTFSGTGEIPDFTEEAPAPWSGYVGEIQTVYANGVTKIGSNAFANAQKLLLIETDESLVTIGDNAFLDCVKMWGHDIASAETVGAGAFSNNTAMTSLTLEKAAQLGAGAFSNNTALTNVSLGARLTVIDADVFSGCSALTGMLIPESVTGIGQNAFGGCASLRSVNIPAKTAAVSSGAFSGCQALEKVYFYGNVPASLAQDGFDGCAAGLTFYYRSPNADWEALGGVWNSIPVCGLTKFYTEQKDHYSFANSHASFGYPVDYRIPRQRYVDVLDSIIKGTYYYVVNEKWGGSCYGMAATTLSFYENPEEYRLSDYGVSAQDLFAVPAPMSASAKLTRLIEAGQISQYKPSIASSSGAVYRNYNSLRTLIQRVEDFERSGGLSVDSDADPVIMVICSENAGHAVVPVSVEQADNGDFLMKIYDPNEPRALQTLTVKKDLSAIEYGPYRSASYMNYSTFANAMSGVVLHDSTVDTSVYLSIDSDHVSLTNEAGEGIDQIEGAYEQMHLNGAADDTFSGIRSYVLPEGNYQIRADQAADAGSQTKTGTKEQQSVTFYMASEDSFAEITSSDRDAVLTVNSTGGNEGDLTIAVESDSAEPKTTVINLVNEQGMERSIEITDDAAVTVSQEGAITVNVQNDAAVTIDGQTAAVENGQTVSSFVAGDADFSVKIKEFLAEAACDEKNELGGTISAELISNSASARNVTLNAEFFDEKQEKVSSISKQVQLNPGRNHLSWEFEKTGASFGVEEGDVTLTCRLTVTDEAGKTVNASTGGITVTVSKPKDPEPTDPEPTEPTDPEPTEPEPTDPLPTDPKPTDPEPTDPKPTEPEPTDPLPTDPKPTDPKPTDPLPTDPLPTDPKPTDPLPTDPLPTDPEPTDPKPTDPLPTDPLPTDPKPTDPLPTNPKPTDQNSGDSQLQAKVQSIRVTAKSNKVVVGNKLTLKAEVLPLNAANKQVIWSSGNTKYATVSKSGIVTPKKAGAGKSVVITAKAADGSGIKGTYRLQIKKALVTKIKLTAKASVKAGKKLTIKAVVTTNSPAASKKLKWTTSNKKYATVSKKGVVTAKKAGKGKRVTITAKATDGSKKTAKIRIKIK